MFLYLFLSIFIYYANAYHCGGWGILVRREPKEDGFQLTCPNNEYKVLMNATELCCIPQPDCPPGLVPETPLDPDKYYDRSLQIGCIEAPETTSKQTTSQAWDEEMVNVNIKQSAIQPWALAIAVSCTVTIVLFATCVGTIIFVETMHSMQKENDCMNSKVQRFMSCLFQMLFFLKLTNISVQNHYLFIRKRVEE